MPTLRTVGLLVDNTEGKTVIFGGHHMRSEPFNYTTALQPYTVRFFGLFVLDTGLGAGLAVGLGVGLFVAVATNDSDISAGTETAADTDASACTDPCVDPGLVTAGAFRHQVGSVA